MATIDITVVQGALPLSDDTLVLRVTLDNSADVIELTGVKLQDVQEGEAAFNANSAGGASGSLLTIGGATFLFTSTMAAAGTTTDYRDAQVAIQATSTLLANATVNSNVQINVVRGGLRYNEAYTLRVTLDGASDTLDLTGVELEPGDGEAAVDVVDPVTTEDSIFYQVASGTPATGQQIWHDDSPNTVVLPSGKIEQTVIRDFYAQVWDTDYTWGAVTLIQTASENQLALAGVVYSESTLSGALGGTLPLTGTLTQANALDGALSTQEGLSGTLQQPTDLAGTMTVGVPLSATLQTQTQLTAGLVRASALQGLLQQATELTAGLELSVILRGAVEQGTSLSGNLVGGTLEFSGTLQQGTSFTGALKTLIPLSAELLQQGELQGGLDIGVPLSGTLQQVSDLTGEPNIRQVFRGTLTQRSFLEASINSTLPLAPLALQTQTILTGQLVVPNLNSSGWLTPSDIYMHTALTVDSIYFKPE